MNLIFFISTFILVNYRLWIKNSSNHRRSHQMVAPDGLTRRSHPLCTYLTHYTLISHNIYLSHPLYTGWDKLWTWRASRFRTIICLSHPLKSNKWVRQVYNGWDRPVRSSGETAIWVKIGGFHLKSPYREPTSENRLIYFKSVRFSFSLWNS